MRRRLAGVRTALPAPVPAIMGVAVIEKRGEAIGTKYLGM